MTGGASFSSNLFQQGNNTGIEVPAGVIDALDAGKRPAVIVTVNGFEYRSTVAVMGGRHLIPFSSDKRAATGLAGGDAIDVTLVIDAVPRTVEVPADLATALEAAGLRSVFDALAPSARKAHVTSVESAKAPQTRARRIESIRLKLGS
ncbi:MAG: YdeI/OmpD-associated family protein [Microbacterium sp.]|uniref:YdeI/OmpD-associated family protein n=1 Tax=Microbacterium sp. TaxID=51671 RepID=UPI00271FD7F3|nr:YdeI/OmpD-associated family protein [Microbacterium sp.]MDO8381588.1 YdeI/OmpD-associated family protein [Microbacterium sp.]